MAKTLFVTPDFTSDVYQCRTLRTPNNAEWLGVFNKALLIMKDAYNWEQINATDLTVDDTIALVTTIIDEFWATETCGTGCALPGLDSPPFRLGVDGHFEMLDPVTGEWGAPTGEYEIPPTPPREETTTEERLCNAAANAAHVMELVYEAITDEIALGGDALQVAAAMVATLVTAVGGWIAAPVYAIIQLGIAFFVGMIELLQVLGGDVWTTEFNEQLKCALFACATDTGDVVTFDLTCIREQLSEPPDLLDPAWFYKLQLFAQVLYLMETITMDGLNAAGATTGVTDDDCSCGIHCMLIDFKVTNGSSLGFTIQGGTYNSGVGYEGIVFLSQKDVWGYWDFGVTVQAIDIRMRYTKTGGTDGNNVNRLIALAPAATGYNTDYLTEDADNTTNPTEELVKILYLDDEIAGIGFDINSGVGASGETVVVHALRVTYRGEIPSGWSDNCDD